MASTNPLPFFTPVDVSTEDDTIVCTLLTPEDQLRYGWRFARALKWLERLPFPIP